MELGIRTDQDGSDCTVALEGEVDVYTAPRLKAQLVELIDDGCISIIVDLEKVAFIDSSGLGVLVGAAAAGAREGRRGAHRLHARQRSEDLPDHRTRQGLSDLLRRRGGLGVLERPLTGGRHRGNGTAVACVRMESVAKGWGCVRNQRDGTRPHRGIRSHNLRA